MNQNIDQDAIYTAADALSDALVKAGVTHVFLNSGTDYPPIIESWAKYEALGYTKPEIIICPHENLAITAAQGFAQITGQPQAVFVHVDVGTQNLGGSLHNVFRNRTPMFILAGLSPATIEGELKGGRDSSIQFIQNAADQAGIVRGYVKLITELKSGKNTQQMVYRALQIASSDPKGPVYMMASREPLEEEGINVNADMRLWQPIAPVGLDGGSLDILTEALAGAKNPLIITSYLGRNKDSVAELIQLSEKLGVPILDSGASYMNFPTDHPMHYGGFAQPLLKDADVILVIDCDLPWTPSMTKIPESCRVFYLDVDPLKNDIPVWYIPSERFIRGDSYTALKQLNERFASGSPALDAAMVASRLEKGAKHLEEKLAQRKSAEQMQEVMTPQYVAACVREIISEDTVIVNEALSSTGAVSGHIPRSKPGTMFQCGGSSLGYFGGAAVGMKLACPEKEIVAFAGDGVYMLSSPEAVYWAARRYETPFLTVIFNNQGWNAPKMITRGQHPDGYAVRDNKYWTSFQPSARLDLIAEASGGAFARMVEKPEDLMPVLLEAKEAVKNGVAAVINVILPPV